MVKTKGPLLSADAHGSIADTLTFSHRKTGKQVRKYTRPGKLPTAKQRGQRRLTEFLVAQWQNMSDADKATWVTKAKDSGKNVAGYHYFLREAQRDLYTHHGLVMYLHCNEIIAGKVLDLSGNANHGTLKPVYPSDAPTLIKSRTKKFGNALYYDGIHNWLDLGSGATLNVTGTYSLLVWCKPSVNYRIVTLTRGLNSSNALFLGAGTDRKGLFYVKNSGVHKIAKAPDDLPLNKYIQMVGVSTGTNILLYLNAVLEGSDGYISPPTFVQNMRIAYLYPFWAATARFTGPIDEICIYNRALSAGEVATRYKLARREAPA